MRRTTEVSRPSIVFPPGGGECERRGGAARLATAGHRGGSVFYHGTAGYGTGLRRPNAAARLDAEGSGRRIVTRRVERLGRAVRHCRMASRRGLVRAGAGVARRKHGGGGRHRTGVSAAILVVMLRHPSAGLLHHRAIHRVCCRRRLGRQGQGHRDQDREEDSFHDACSTAPKRFPHRWPRATVRESEVIRLAKNYITAMIQINDGPSSLSTQRAAPVRYRSRPQPWCGISARG